MNNKCRKTVFIAIIAVAYLSLLIFNFLTPHMSDDFYYQPGTRRTIGWIINKAIDNYMTHNGRFIPQLCMTWCLSIPKPLFNVINSAVFIILCLCIYLNIIDFQKKEMDITSLLTVFLAMWIFAVAPGQTLLWVAGACNYLWATTISFGFFTLLRYIMVREINIRHKVIFAVIVFVFGVCSGTCNENTSGGVLLLILYYTLQYVWSHNERLSPISIIKKIPSWLCAGIVGMVVGITMLVGSPGNRIRLAETVVEEEHTGILAYVGRLLRLNGFVKDDFSVLGILIIVILVYCIVAKISMDKMLDIYAYILCAVAVVYVLILTITPMDRVLFGASIFLITALGKLMLNIRNNDVAFVTLRYSLVVIGMLCFAYTFISDGANLMRIQRELNERAEYAAQQKAEGIEDVVLPMLRTEWDNRYTFIYLNDITEDIDGWGNRLYRGYYDVDDVIGVPREVWDEMEMSH